MEKKLSISIVSALCALPCAAVVAFAANAALACGLLVCWLVCSLLIWAGEASGRALSKRFGKNGGGVGVWVVCAALIIPVAAQVCRDLSLPKPPENAVINLWGLGSLLISLMILPPVFSAAVLNAAALVKRRKPAESEPVPRGKRAAKIIAVFVAGLAGYAAALLIIMLF